MLVIFAIFCIASLKLVEGSCVIMDDMNTEAVEKHNIVRARHDVSPLAYDATLAEHANTYSKKMCETGIFEHDTSELSRYGEGENLFMENAGDLLGACMVVWRWYDEIRDFDWTKLNTFYNVFPIPGNVGHFTQIVWRDTSKVGCGGAYKKEGSKYKMYVTCRYKEAGNVLFEFPDQVKKPTTTPYEIGHSELCSTCVDSDPTYCANMTQFDCNRAFFNIKDKCKKTCGAC